jgi:hypothetical protein
VLATLNLLAFAFHTVAELTHALWLKAINRQEPAAASSNVYDQSPFSSFFPLGATCSQPWHSLIHRHSPHDKSSK